MPQTLQIDDSSAFRNSNVLMEQAPLRGLPDDLNFASRSRESPSALQSGLVGHYKPVEVVGLCGNR
ncbi:MAG: hypothetical protein ACLPZ0_05450 [Steroidobacteraceae bacterium]|nr:hypothetical protein [Steroidobacteraceae bacterium]